jgi:hypothetical protein
MYKLTKIQHIWSKGKSTNLAKKKKKEALKHSNNKISSKAAQQNSIISSIHQMRDIEREKKKKKLVGSCAGAPCSALCPPSCSLRHCVRCALCYVLWTVSRWPHGHGSVEAWTHGSWFCRFPFFGGGSGKGSSLCVWFVLLCKVIFGLGM